MPGWTLALDIPAAAPGLAPLLDGLDRLVVDGRRPRLPGEGLPPPSRAARMVMYPRLAAFRELRARVDPRRAPVRSVTPSRAGLEVVQDAFGGVQSVLVLGGASDIALAIVRRLVAPQARVVGLAVRNPEAFEVTGEGSCAALGRRRSRRSRSTPMTSEHHEGFVRTTSSTASATSTSCSSRSASSATRPSGANSAVAARPRARQLPRGGLGAAARRPPPARPGPRHDRRAVVGGR